MKIGIAAVSWLLISASFTYAAPDPGRGRNRLTCDVRAQALRKLLRLPKSYGGPLATNSPRERIRIRFDLTHHVRRVKRTANSNEGAAIQNDAPAARVDTDDPTPPSLESLGFLVGAIDSHPRTRSFSPRSPRGPPPAA
jgi:hypothetical protein